MPKAYPSLHPEFPPPFVLFLFIVIGELIIHDVFHISDQAHAPHAKLIVSTL